MNLQLYLHFRGAFVGLLAIATSTFLALLITGLDGLVCNAGALLSTRTLTKEGEEITVS
jgi:hypothetical protein